MNIVQRKHYDACIIEISFISSCSKSDNEHVNTHVNVSSIYFDNDNDSYDYDVSEDVLLEHTLKDCLFENTDNMYDHEFPYLSKYNIPFNSKEIVCLTGALVQLNPMLRKKSEINL